MYESTKVFCMQCFYSTSPFLSLFHGIPQSTLFSFSFLFPFPFIFVLSHFTHWIFQSNSPSITSLLFYCLHPHLPCPSLICSTLPPLIIRLFPSHPSLFAHWPSLPSSSIYSFNLSPSFHLSFILFFLSSFHIFSSFTPLSPLICGSCFFSLLTFCCCITASSQLSQDQ